MAQAFDRDNNALGDMEFGKTLREAFLKADSKHPEAHSIMTSRLEEMIPIKTKPNLKVREAVSKAIIRNRIDEALEKVQMPNQRNDEGLEALSTTAIFGGGKGIDPEIQKLTKSVMEAAAGKPLKISITEQRRQQQIVEGFIKQFRERQLSEVQEGQSKLQTTAEGQSSTPAPPSNAKTKSDPSPVTIDDLSGIQKSIEKLASGLAQESK